MSETHLSVQPPAEPAWRRRKDSRKPELLLAARRVFEDVGYERASVAQIAAAAGVSEATVYKYFESKQDLLHQVFEAWMTPDLEILERDLFKHKGAGERLRALAVHHLDEMSRSTGLHRLVYRELRWEGYRDSPFYKLNQRYAGLVERVVAEGIADGEIRGDVDARLTRDVFFGGLEHAGWRMVSGGRKIDVVPLAEKLAAQIYRGVAVRSDGEMPDLVERLTKVAERLEKVR